jgi:hypothetical protein
VTTKFLIRVWFWLFALLAPAAPGLAADFEADASSEQAIRAALLFNFIKFTQWPAAAIDNLQFQVCIATSDRAQITAIEALNLQMVRGKPLAVVHFNRQADCDVIYVDSHQRWHEISEQRITGVTLTIGSYAGFVADGGMIEISLQEGRARFDINLLEAKRARLYFYPQLLRLARRIVE